MAKLILNLYSSYLACVASYIIMESTGPGEQPMKITVSNRAEKGSNYYYSQNYRNQFHNLH